MNQILNGRNQELIRQEKNDIKIVKPDKNIKFQNKESKNDWLENNKIGYIDVIKSEIYDVEQTKLVIKRAEKNQQQKKCQIKESMQSPNKEKVILVRENQNLGSVEEQKKKQSEREPVITCKNNNAVPLMLEREKNRSRKKIDKKDINTKKGIKTVNIKVIPLLIVVLLIITIVIGGPKVYSSLTNKPENNEEVKVAVDENNQEKEQNQGQEPIQEEESEAETYVASDGNEYHTLGIVEVPNLNIKYPILAETTDDLLKVSVTKYWGANPNKVGNLVIVGHNYKNTQMFSKLTNLEKGDIIKITDNDKKTLDYKVYDMKKIDPYDNDCTSQKTKGKTEVTLITCADNGSNRYYVKARAD